MTTTTNNNRSDVIGPRTKNFRGLVIFLKPRVCDLYVGSKRAEYYIAELSLGVMLDGCQYGAGNWPLLKGFLQRGASRALKGVSQALYSLNFARAGIYYFLLLSFLRSFRLHHKGGFGSFINHVDKNLDFFGPPPAMWTILLIKLI